MKEKKSDVLLRVLPSCAKDCINSGESCDEKQCRYWIEYESEKNCTLISIEENGNMTLEETAKRLNLSVVRVFQIQKKAF